MSPEGERESGREGETRRRGEARPPLEGVRVFDLTRVIAGPYCTMMLADLGADVVKVEEPEKGDETRWIVRYAGRAAHDEDFFYAVNRGKRSVTLDLKHSAGREAAWALALQADVVVENFAPGVAARLGLGAEALRAAKPSLIYCSISGYGQTGPYRDRRAVDPMIQAVSGLMSVTGEPDGAPMRVGTVVSDVLGGMFAAYAIVGALHGRTRDGQGRTVDLSMLDATLAMIGPRLGETLQAGLNPQRVGNENPMRAPANVYLTADDHYVDVMVQNDLHWPTFCRALEREQWLEDDRFQTVKDRLAHRAELNAIVAERIRDRTADEWLAQFTAARIPAARVNTYLDAVADAQVAHRGLLLDLEHQRSGHIRVIGPPWQMTGAPPTLVPPPLLGEHTGEVLREWLGWPNAEIDRLRATGATEGGRERGREGGRDRR